MVTKILEQIEQISQTFLSYKHSGTMSAVERDLIQDKLRRLYEETLDDTFISSVAACPTPVSTNVPESVSVSEKVSENKISSLPEKEEVEGKECELYESVVAESGYRYDGALSTYIGHSDLQTVLSDLFGSDTAYANRFLHQLDEFTDLDQAILYIQETIPEKLNSPSVAILADALTSKLG